MLDWELEVVAGFEQEFQLTSHNFQLPRRPRCLGHSSRVSVTQPRMSEKAPLGDTCERVRV